MGFGVYFWFGLVWGGVLLLCVQLQLHSGEASGVVS